MNREDMMKMQTTTSCRFGEPTVNPELERQAAAGEEDQSEPGWDSAP